MSKRMQTDITDATELRPLSCLLTNTNGKEDQQMYGMAYVCQSYNDILIFKVKAFVRARSTELKETELKRSAM